MFRVFVNVDKKITKADLKNIFGVTCFKQPYRQSIVLRPNNEYNFISILQRDGAMWSTPTSSTTRKQIRVEDWRS